MRLSKFEISPPGDEGVPGFDERKRFQLLSIRAAVYAFVFGRRVRRT